MPLALFLLLAAPTSSAWALDFDLHWQPSPDQGIVEYKLYAREDGRSFGPPVSAGLPPVVAGSMTATLRGLRSGPRYYFAVSAVASSGDTSRLSNEISPCTLDAECNDANPCTNDACVAGVCRSTAGPNGIACSDGNRCNGDETCQQGVCTHGAAPACADSNACTTDGCSPATGCTFTPISGCRPCLTATQCDDGNPCTTDTCTPRGTCTNVLVGSCATCTTDIQCDDHNPCSTDTCTGGRCHSTSRANGESCSDGNPCNGEETCQVGKCKAGGFPCDDHDPCTADLCTADDGCAHETSASCATCDGVPQGEFDAKWLSFYTGRSSDRLTAMGVLDPAGPVNPTHTGVSMEIRDSTGDIVYRIVVPADNFKSNPSRRTFKLDSRRARQLRADGLKRFNIVITSDGMVRVYFRVKAPDFPVQFPKGYTWSILFGDHCGVSECFLRPRHAKCE